MACFRTPSLRYTVGNATAILRPSQRRWAQVHDVRFLVTHQRSDSILERYTSKLQQKAKKEGLRDVDELKAVYQDKIKAQQKKALAAEIPPVQPSSSAFPEPPPPPSPSASFPPASPDAQEEKYQHQHQQQQQPSPQSANHSPSPSPKQSASAAIKPLSSYLDIPKTLSLPPKEIEYIWRLRHASNPQSLCAAIALPTYARIEATARRHPQFILPLPREEKGAEIHFLQWAFPTPDTSTVLFTHLAEFKLRGEYAQPHTTVTHHLDLAGEKGLVLLQGSVVEGRGVTVDEGKWLLMCLQKFYAGEGDDGGQQAQKSGGKGPKRRLLEQFSQGDGEFKVEELLEEAEKIV